MSIEHEHKAYREGYIAGRSEAYRKGWEDAKEECARVADEAAKKYEWSLEPAIAPEIAAAIRALKDKT